MESKKQRMLIKSCAEKTRRQLNHKASASTVQKEK